MLQDRQYVTVDNTELKPVFQEWVKLFREARKSFIQCGNEWWTERCHTSLLSTAAWKAGCPSIIEVKTRKSDSPSGTVWNGYADLVVVAGTSRYGVESKLLWLESENDVNSIAPTLESASLDARYLNARMGGQPVALLFGMFWQRGESSIEGTVEESLQFIQTLQAIDIVVWDVSVDDQGAAVESRKNFCPGGFVVGKSISV